MATVDQKPGIFFTKKIALLTGNTCEALQCVRYHQTAPEGAYRPFKVLALVCAKMIDIISLYVAVGISTRAQPIIRW